MQCVSNVGNYAAPFRNGVTEKVGRSAGRGNRDGDEELRIKMHLLIVIMLLIYFFLKI